MLELFGVFLSTSAVWFVILIVTRTGAYQNGYDAGVEYGTYEVCRSLANMNREQRRAAVRRMVRQLKDEEKRPR